MTTELDRVYKVVGSLDRNEVPDGYVIYDEQRELVHFLNVAAAATLELCNGQFSVDAIAATMQADFGLSTPPVADVEACVALLLEKGLIEPCRLSLSET